MSFITNVITGLFEADEDEEKREEEISQSFHRHESFAPVRHDVQVKYFIDGQNYCWAVSEAIENARSVIFIEDWWLSPELYLRRPPAKYPEYRLDVLLKRKAEEGVKIFVVVYKEVSMALSIASKHTKQTLEALHENIIVQRSPDFSLKGRNSFWSHHEKFVIVDNLVAFLGGLDLCYGRWDTHSHRLADFTDGTGMETFIGQDYNDARFRDFEDVKEWDRRLIDKTVVPRMPWHDVSLCMMGGPVLDVQRHFCERWNYIKHEKAGSDDRILYMKPALGGFGHHQLFDIDISADESYRFLHGTRNVSGTCRAQVLRSVCDWSLGVEKVEHSIQNAYISTIQSAEHFVYIENQFFITSTMSEEEDEKYVLKNQIAKAIVERITRAYEEQERFKVIVVMPLMPAFPADLSTKAAATARMVMDYQYMSISRGGKSIMELLSNAGIEPSEYIRFYSLRSHDVLSRTQVEEMLARADGFGAQPSLDDEVEYTSVAQQYSDDNSDGNNGLKNSDFVSEELYIHSKLLIADDKVVIMGSANLNDRSQCGSRDSEIALIVHDQEMIPSQMNGNDYEAARFAATLRRQLWKEHLGLLGDERDRALDDVNEDMMPLPVPQLDTTDTDNDRLVMDPLSDETLALWNDTARTNTEAFRNVFHCVPDDNVHNWDEYKEFHPDAAKIDLGHVYDPNMSVDDILQELSQVRGHLVEFPMEFLKDVDLQGESIPFISDFTQELYT